jgi:hypothetical protein
VLDPQEPGERGPAGVYPGVDGYATNARPPAGTFGVGQRPSAGGTMSYGFPPFAKFAKGGAPRLLWFVQGF